MVAEPLGGDGDRHTIIVICDDNYKVRTD